MVRRRLAMFLCAVAMSLVTAAGADAAPFGQCPAIGSAASCDVLITVGGDGTVSLAVDSSVSPYDGSDDMLVGVQNNSPRSLESLSLSSATTAIFGFDQDGICTYTSCSWSAPTGYEGPFTTLSAEPSQDSGTVTFTGTGLPAGQSTYFSLEGAPDTVTGSTSGTAQTTVTPAGTNDPAFNRTPAHGSGSPLAVTVAKPPPLIAPNGTVIRAHGGVAGAFDPSDPSTYGPCDPGSNTSPWHAAGVTVTCLLSGAAFNDPTLGPKNRCIVHVGADILTWLVPVAKARLITDLGKLKTPLTSLAAGLKVEGHASDASKVLDASKLLASISSDVAHGDGVSAVREAVSALAGSETLLKVVKSGLHVKSGDVAYGRLVVAQNAFKQIGEDLTGISDVKSCIEAF